MNHYAVFMVNGQAIRVDTDTAIEHTEGRIVFTDEAGNVHHIAMDHIVDIVKVTDENYKKALEAESAQQQNPGQSPIVTQQ